MRFKPAQVLDLLEISSDTLRHWKKAIVPIATKDGRADGYSMAELLSLAIIARVTHHLKVQVSLFTDFSTKLFEWVEEMVEAGNFHQVLFIDQSQASLGDPRQIPEADVLLAVKIWPIIEELRAKIGAINPHPNEPFLPFAH